MADEGNGSGSGGYKKNWVKYLLIYLVVGGAAYAIIWYAFLKDGGLYG